METILQEYVTLCRMVGGWTDWVQGPGGNISIKEENQLLIKRSGALLGDTTESNGWVLCDIDKVKTAYNSNQESIAHTILKGDGNPSIETFLHCLPDRIIVHLHPAFLLGILCESTPDKCHTIDDQPIAWIPYAKPGIPLAKLLFDSVSSHTRIYMLENHGVLFTGHSVQDILENMIRVSKYFKPPVLNHLPFTNIQWAVETYRTYKEESMILQPLGNVIHSGTNIVPYTPDIAVFLTKDSILCDGEQIYCVGKTLQECSILRDLYLSYQYAVQMGAHRSLSYINVQELRSWDKEKLRRKGPL